MLRKREWRKKIVHGNGIGKKILHITIPEKNSLPAVNHNNPPPPTPSKVKWSAPTLTIPLLRFCSALHCAYSDITDIQDCLFFVLTRARTFLKS
jgi:hypothetical protein